MSFYVYMLRCRDGSYYAGQTSDPVGRLHQHNNGLLKGYTHGRRPVRLVWCQEFGSRDEAMAAEKQVKGWSRAKKEALARDDWDEVSYFAKRGPGPSFRPALRTLAKDSPPRPSRASGTSGLTDAVGHEDDKASSLVAGWAP